METNDLRKAAEMALEALEDVVKWYASRDANENLMPCHNQNPEIKLSMESLEALRQALAHEALDEMVAENQRLGLYDDGPAVKTYAGGKPNYCTPEVTGEVTGDVDGVNTSQDRVDETAKREHEPVAWINYNAATGEETINRDCHSELGSTPLYKTPPKREWVGLTDDEMQETGRYSYCRGGTSEKLYHIMWNSQPSASVGWCRDELIAFARAIEAKLKEKNT